MPYKVDPDVYRRVVENFNPKSLERGLRIVDEIAERVSNGDLQRDLEKVFGMAAGVLSLDKGSIFNDDVTLYKDAQELEEEIKDWIKHLKALAKALERLGDLEPASVGIE